MRTCPRELGLRLHTLAVKASALSNGSPKAGSDSGCTWYCTLAQARSGEDFAKAPSCEGDMLIGPLRRSRYSRPIAALPHSEFAIVFSVRTPCTP